jgi:outer membrane protein
MLTVVLLFSLEISGHAWAWDFEVAVGGWQQSLGGELGYEIEDSDDDIINLEQDFDFDDELRLFGRAKIELPLFFPNFYLISAPMDFEGTGSKSVEIKYGDVTFASGADLDTKLTMNMYDFALYWAIPVLKTATDGIFNIDLGLNVRILDLEATISGEDAVSANVVEESASGTIPVPMLYVAFQIEPIDEFAIEVEGRGLSIGDNKLYSLIGRLRYNFYGPAFVTAGYRYDKLEIDEEDILVDVNFGGPFAELGLFF